MKLEDFTEEELICIQLAVTWFKEDMKANNAQMSIPYHIMDDKFMEKIKQLR